MCDYKNGSFFARGDIIIAKCPSNPNTMICKRIAAMVCTFHFSFKICNLQTSVRFDLLCTSTNAAVFWIQKLHESSKHHQWGGQCSATLLNPFACEKLRALPLVLPSSELITPYRLPCDVICLFQHLLPSAPQTDLSSLYASLASPLLFVPQWGIWSW